MTFFKDPRKHIDVVIFVLVLVFLIAGQLIGKSNQSKDRQMTDPNAKLLTISDISQVCVDEPSEASVCYGIKNTQYNVLIVKDDGDFKHHLLITYAKGP
jgi:hypothetical protein